MTYRELARRAVVTNMSNMNRVLGCRNHGLLLRAYQTVDKPRKAGLFTDIGGLGRDTAGLV